MRRLTASVVSSVLIAPAVVMAPTLSLPHLPGHAAAKPHVVDPAVTALALTPTGATTAPVRAGSAATTGDVSALAVTRPPAVLTGLLSTKDFQTLAVTWDLPKRTVPAILVRARTHDSHGWSGWFTLERDDVYATAADVEGRSTGYRGGTEPYWAGDSDGVQVRVDLLQGALPTGLKVELIDPGRSAYDATVGTQPPGSATASPTEPLVFTRADWGADESKVRDRPTVMPTIKAAVIHHTAGKNAYSRAEVPGILRSTFAYHLSRGWDDIGYNFLVDRFGRIWEGRGGGIDRPIQGAHTGGFNYETFGVSIMGSYEAGTKPSAAALDAVSRLVAWKLDLHRVDPRGKVTLTSSGGGTSRYAPGKRVTLPTIFAHRDVGYTACPGKNVYAKMDLVRAKVFRYTQAQLIAVHQTTRSVAYGATAPAVTFRPLTTQSWRLSVADACTDASVGATGGSVVRGRTVRAVWSGRIGGVPAKAGTYRARVTSSSTLGAARPFTSTFTVRPPAGPPVLTGAPGPDGVGGFTPVRPARLYNSRAGASQPLGPGGRLDLKVTDRAGVPAEGVTAVVLQVAAMCASNPTSFTVRPAGQALGGPPALSVASGKAVRSTEVVVPVGAGGHVSVRNAAGVAHLLVDLVGYYRIGSGAGFRSVPPTVAYDSTVTGDRQPMRSGDTQDVTLPDVAGAPRSTITAALVNLSVIGPKANGRLNAYPTGAPSGVTSLAYGRTSTTELTTVAVRGGRFTLRNTGSTVHVQAEVVGVFSTAATAGYDELTPRRIWGGASGGTVGSAVRTVRVAGTTQVPADATAVRLRFVASGAPSGTRILTWAGTAGDPRSVNPVVRLGRRTTVTNEAVVPVLPSGMASFRAAAGDAKVSIQVVGFYR